MNFGFAVELDQPEIVSYGNRPAMGNMQHVLNPSSVFSRHTGWAT